MTLSTRTFTANDIPQLEQLEMSYARVFPQRTPVPAQFYLSPYFKNGENVLCAFDENGCLVAYAPVFLQNDRAWVEVEALPGLEKAVEIKNILWEWILDKARQDRLHKLCFQYFPEEEEAIRFAESQGAHYAYSIFSMQRDLEQPIPLLPAPEGFNLRRWRMESEAEQRQYLAGRNECFPEAPTSLEEWQYFTRTPLWEQGVNMAAFWDDILAASVLVYWMPESQSGSTEHVFTRRDYRGRGLARLLLVESLAYLKDHGLQQALLEVKADNRSALGLYFELGFAVAADSRVLEVII